MDYKNGRNRKPWAVKTKLGWTLSEHFPKHKNAQLATAFHASDKSKQVKSWRSLEFYASNWNVSARTRDEKKTTETLEKTTHLVIYRFEIGLLWAENKEIPNIYFHQHTLTFAHWS